MELKEKCKILNTKGNREKVNCHTFNYERLDRKLAIHEDTDRKGVSVITDPKSGLALCQIQKPISSVTESNIEEALEKFIKHFTLEVVLGKFAELDQEK